MPAHVVPNALGVGEVELLHLGQGVVVGVPLNGREVTRNSSLSESNLFLSLPENPEHMDWHGDEGQQPEPRAPAPRQPEVDDEGQEQAHQGHHLQHGHVVNP